MKCPACGTKAAGNAWICAKCDHILDPSVLEPTDNGPQAESGKSGASPIREERTKLIAWPNPEQEDSLPDAVILGNVDVAEGEFAVVHGAGAAKDGKTSTFLFYAAGSTTRVVHPDAVPRLTHHDTTLPRTPYEDFILSCVDGLRSVRDIQRASGLAPQEVAVTLLTLLDKNAVEIVSPDGKPGASPRKKSKKDKKALPSALPTPPTAPSLASPGEPEADDELLETQALSADVVMAVRGRIKAGLPADFDELPSVSDFEDVHDESRDGTLDAEGTQDEPDLPSRVLRARPRSEKPTQNDAPPSRGNSMSDVWSEGSISAADAAALIEEEKSLDERPEPERAPVMPRDLDEDDAEEATAELRVQAELDRARDKTPPPRTKPSSPAVLDPAFLLEVPNSKTGRNASLLKSEDSSPVVGPLAGSAAAVAEDEGAKEARRKVLAEAVKRATLGARGKRDGGAAPPERQERQERQPIAAVEPRRVEAPVQQRPEPGTPRAERKSPADPVDGQRMLKAQKLFEQAIKDRGEGNLVSARMNMKLALTFDPSNEMYQGAFDDLNKNPEAQPKGPGSGALENARELYNAATEAENSGDVDRAIELLEKAIRESKQPTFLNRLGVILAMKKHNFARAQELVEQAIDLAPGNATYEKNLSKILAMAASMDMNKDQAGVKKGGILGFLGRKR